MYIITTTAKYPCILNRDNEYQYRSRDGLRNICIPQRWCTPTSDKNKLKWEDEYKATSGYILLD